MLTWLKRAAGLACFIVALACAQSGFAQAPGAAPSPPRLLSQSLSAGMTLERYLDSLRASFRMGSINGETISAADAELHARAGAAFMRSTALMMIMGADLDGDGAVTEDELRQFLRYQRRLDKYAPGTRGPSMEERIEAEVRKLMEMDTDHDGKITFAEALN